MYTLFWLIFFFWPHVRVIGSYSVGNRHLKNPVNESSSKDWLDPSFLNWARRHHYCILRWQAQARYFTSTSHAEQSFSRRRCGFGFERLLLRLTCLEHYPTCRLSHLLLEWNKCLRCGMNNRHLPEPITIAIFLGVLQLSATGATATSKTSIATQSERSPTCSRTPAYPLGLAQINIGFRETDRQTISFIYRIFFFFKPPDSLPLSPSGF